MNTKTYTNYKKLSIKNTPNFIRETQHSRTTYHVSGKYTALEFCQQCANLAKTETEVKNTNETTI